MAVFRTSGRGCRRHRVGGRSDPSDARSRTGRALGRPGRHRPRHGPGGARRLRRRSLGGDPHRGGRGGTGGQRQRCSRTGPIRRACHQGRGPCGCCARCATNRRKTLLSLGGRLSSRFLGILLGDTATDAPARRRLLGADRPSEAGPDWEPRNVVVGLDGSAAALTALAATDELAARSVQPWRSSPRPAASPSAGSAPWARKGRQLGDGASRWRRSSRARARSRPRRRRTRGLHRPRALGSVSERVAHQARCSVLVVHDASPARDA